MGGKQRFCECVCGGEVPLLLRKQAETKCIKSGSDFYSSADDNINNRQDIGNAPLCFVVESKSTRIIPICLKRIGDG